jgi:hypothetical protein
MLYAEVMDYEQMENVSSARATAQKSMAFSRTPSNGFGRPAPVG